MNKNHTKFWFENLNGKGFFGHLDSDGRIILKGKIVPVLNELSTTPLSHMGSGCIYPHFLDSAVVGGEWSASRPGRFTPGGRAPRYPMDRRLRGAQSRSGRFGEEKILDPTGTRTPTPQSSSTYPVAIPTTLPRLLDDIKTDFKYVVGL
jgi:hypothetical protein